MPSKKTKTTPEPEIVKAAEPAPATKAKIVKSKAATTPAAPKSSAATHKTAARKPAARQPLAAAAAAGSAITLPASAPAKPAFDPSAFHNEIASEAYFQWVNRGGTHGSEQEDWLRAVEIVRARHS